MEYIQVMASIYVSKILKDTFFCVCRNLTDYSLYIDTFALKFPKYNHLFFCSAQLTQPLKNVKVVRSQKTRNRWMYGVENTLVYLNEFPRERDVDSIGTFNGIATVKNNKVVYPMSIWQLIKYQHYLGIVPKVCYNDFIGYY